MIILGCLFLLVVLFMPNGIVGLPAQFRGIKAKFAARKNLTTEPAAEAN